MPAPTTESEARWEWCNDIISCTSLFDVPRPIIHPATFAGPKVPRRGDGIELDIRGLTAQGDGWTRIGDSEFIVRRTLPGDRVEATLRRKKGRTWEATADHITNVRIPRVAPECPHFGVCGGCRWQDLSYTDQLKLKERMVANALEQQGLNCDEQRPMVSSRAPFFYRNKMEFSFGRDCGGGTLLGLHHRGRYNRVFDVRDCRLQSQLSNRIVETVRSCASVGKVPEYDLKTHEGILRFLVVREGRNSGEVMVNLVVSEYPDKGVGDLVRCVLDRVPEITTLVVTLHRGKAQAAIVEREFVLKGRRQDLGGLRRDRVRDFSGLLLPDQHRSGRGPVRADRSAGRRSGRRNRPRSLLRNRRHQPSLGKTGRLGDWDRAGRGGSGRRTGKRPKERKEKLHLHGRPG